MVQIYWDSEGSTISTKDSTETSTDEDIEQYDQDRSLSPSPPPEPFPEMLVQLDLKPISRDQLILEVKEIYAGLYALETECIAMDEGYLAAAREKDLCQRSHVDIFQWQLFTALHTQLLHEHHDFFLASHHPSAPPALKELAIKHLMPDRLWRHGVSAPLEVLQHGLPDSSEYILAFIHIAYSIIALLYETVPEYQNIWSVYLGMLAKYQMISDNEPKDREVWDRTSSLWFKKAVDKSPNCGRLCYTLAVLASTCSLEQLSLFARSGFGWNRFYGSASVNWSIRYDVDIRSFMVNDFVVNERHAIQESDSFVTDADSTDEWVMLESSDLE